jgi:peptidoglycan hydrolase-like protein with peptidoglycan-binding domain
LRDRGFLAADAPQGTQLGGSIRQFQKSQGLEETGFPDRQTLTRLGIDPDTIDSSLDWRTKNIEGATGAGVSH